MPVRKFAISVPEDVMKQVDRTARRAGLTRSRFVADVLRRIAAARGDAEVTRKVNALFADPGIATEQRGTARAFQRARSDRGARW